MKLNSRGLSLTRTRKVPGESPLRVSDKCISPRNRSLIHLDRNCRMGASYNSGMEETPVFLRESLRTNLLRLFGCDLVLRYLPRTIASIELLVAVELNANQIAFCDLLESLVQLV